MAGPTARATLKATELSATAEAIIPRGTRSGTNDCHAGRLNATPTPRTSPSPSKTPGVIHPLKETHAIAAAAKPERLWATIITFVRSNRSATAPASTARKRVGSRLEATISPTQVADPVSSSINHDPATA